MDDFHGMWLGVLRSNLAIHDSDTLIIFPNFSIGRQSIARSWTYCRRRCLYSVSAFGDSMRNNWGTLAIVGHTLGVQHGETISSFRNGVFNTETKRCTLPATPRAFR